jgi:exodeoxyribonuclease VII large subunit
VPRPGEPEPLPLPGAEPASTTPAGIDGSSLAGPFAVGEYATALRAQLRSFTRVQVFGEVSNLGIRAKAVYFELRDAGGALPCSMWRTDYDRIGVTLENGMQVVLGGGCDYYPGSASSSPSFSFRATAARVAGEGELLAQIERLRRRLHGEGLFEPQKRLSLPALPHTIGVVTGEGGKARDDVLAGLRRRGWEGRLVWAFAPVQDRRAAPLITRALQDLAADGGVETIVVARGGGSVIDLMAFSDETLCRTVALLAVPVIASVGHHTDRSLLDDVAAISCSTPTHAAEAAVRVHAGEARTVLARAATQLQRCGRRAVLERARSLAALSRAPAEHLARHRTRARQQLREVGAAGRRRTGRERERNARRALVLERKAASTATAAGRARQSLPGATRAIERGAQSSVARRGRELERLRLALEAHDPQRTLARGYALVERPGGEPVTAAAEVGEGERVAIRFRDGRVGARIEPDGA